ncbi:hypothetical protein [Jatrophihabitans endophyticus]|uniref:hypothetical protein n=1 Tax=Jatrophihabitans endophyticus TaxID=1206085 RepID=UPI001A0F039F|nr:hypothetical protein [Jatrophihabitans endophyticus]MBE7187586.1 hypothetical protein [Jatrophihabitans endophyticus]
MTEHPQLDDAFAEYERRADAFDEARATAPASPAEQVAQKTRGPLLLIAASVVLVLAVAGGVVWLARGDGATHGSGAPVGGGGPRPVPSATAPRSSATPRPSATLDPVVLAPSPTQSSTSVPAGPPPTTSPTATGTPSSGIPRTASQMERALRRVLGGTATFRVTATQGNYLVGILTVTKTGAKGGFDIQAFQGDPGDRAQCEDPGPHSHCTVASPADGGSLARERETYGTDVLYYVDYVSPNGATFSMHLSNRADPKGAGRTFGSEPPLPIRRMVEIVGSSRWSTN